MASLSEIKNWFRTGLKPTQIQFWATWDSFWHKGTPIPQSAVENLEETLASIGSGGRFGVDGEDNHVSSDRSVDLDSHKFNLNNIGEFNLTGALSNVLIPYNEESMHFEQTNTSGEFSLDGKSLLYISGIPIVSEEMEVYFTVDGSPTVAFFKLFSTYNTGPVWVTDEISGTVIIPMNINPLIDTSKSTFQVGQLEIKGEAINMFQKFDGEQLAFSQSNPFSDITAWDGKSMVSAEYAYGYEESEYPESVTVRVSADGVITDVVFTKDMHYSESNERNVMMWIAPEILGNEVYVSGLVKVSHPAYVTMALPETIYDGQKIVVKGLDGALKYAVLDIPVQNIDSVLSQGPIATIGLTWNYSYNYRTEVNGLGTFVSYQSFDGTGNDWYANYRYDGIGFNTHYLNPTNRYSVTVKPNTSNNSMEPAEIVLPRKSGYIPVKTELYELNHKTYTVAASSMTDIEWIDLVTFDDNSAGSYRASSNTLIYKGTANAAWNIPVDNFDWKYTIINNTNYSITITRGGITTLWADGVSNTSVVIPAKGWANIIGSQSENRFYFKIY